MQNQEKIQFFLQSEESYNELKFGTLYVGDLQNGYLAIILFIQHIRKTTQYISIINLP